jgi:hypothetical protein
MYAYNVAVHCDPSCASHICQTCRDINDYVTATLVTYQWDVVVATVQRSWLQFLLASVGKHLLIERCKLLSGCCFKMLCFLQYNAVLYACL